MSLTRICKKRLMGDQRLLKKQPIDNIKTYPDENNMLVWYFLIEGNKDSPYFGGKYIGKIMHHPDYPLKAPDFMMLTPNGRFTVNKKICLTNSGYHSESWSPMWNIRSILLGFLSIMLSDADVGISHIKRSFEERQMLALSSDEYNKKYLSSIEKKF